MFKADREQWMCSIFGLFLVGVLLLALLSYINLPPDKAVIENVPIERALSEKEAEFLKEVVSEINKIDRANVDTWFNALTVLFAVATLVIAGFAVVLPLMGMKQQDRFREEMTDLTEKARQGVGEIGEHVEAAKKGAREVKKEVDRSALFERHQFDVKPTKNLFDDIETDDPNTDGDNRPGSVRQNSTQLVEEGIDRDPSDAEEKWRLGYRYRFGIGVKEDQEKAVEWFRKSAEQGHAVGQYFLACAYQEGEGVPQNFGEARAWVSLSKSNGDEDAEERMDELDAKMIDQVRLAG